MPISICRKKLNRFSQAIRYEWLETNGLGGYASSTVIGANTRRYHGLLVAALAPPVNRVVLLSKFEETLILGGHRYELSSNKYQGAVYPNGYIFQQSFEKDLFPTFRYQVNGITLTKTIAALHEENTTLILFEVEEAPEDFTLELVPQGAFRDFHYLSSANDQVQQLAFFEEGILRMKYYEDQPEVFISAPSSSYAPQADWYFNFEYQEELHRGMDAYEDLYSPGKLYVPLHAGQKFGMILSTDNPTGRDAWQLFEQEKQRRLGLIRETSQNHPLLRHLTLSADQFLVRRGKDLHSIIAGYPWFSDWGRDSMIALPGICLARGKHQEAKSILQAFALHVSEGMLPNRFPDRGEPPLYNNIDATLWFFIAAYKYMLASGDEAFLAKTLLPVMHDILHWHDEGTRYNIQTAEDGLLQGGEEGVQLTWMDAKADDWVVTPRIGKPVEVNALWYNAWRIFAHFHELLGLDTEAEVHQIRADKIQTRFLEVFWNEETNCLYDCVNGSFKDAAIRPNQIFALSLPFPLLDPVQGSLILHTVEESLLTPRGLRSLAPSDPAYQDIYGGDVFQRDGAYHQGTVWGWLIGPYIDALIYVKGSWGKRMARRLLTQYFPHFQEHTLGSAAEIFDGAPPHTPRGCGAQAWTISELLRVSMEYQLFTDFHLTPSRMREKILDRKNPILATDI
ncbi:MAG: amylo-alpha-1,6-glucosidase [Bacteroidota bacterium]